MTARERVVAFLDRHEDFDDHIYGHVAAGHQTDLTVTDLREILSAEEHHGWPNRETWAFNLHWSNDERLYQAVLSHAVLAQREGVLPDWELGLQIVGSVQSQAWALLLESVPGEFFQADQRAVASALLSEVGSFWRVDAGSIGASIRASLD